MSGAIHLDQLSEQYTSWPTSEEQYSASNLHLHPLDAMRGACSGFN